VLQQLLLLPCSSRERLLLPGLLYRLLPLLWQLPLMLLLVLLQQLPWLDILLLSVERLQQARLLRSCSSTAVSPLIIVQLLQLQNRGCSLLLLLLLLRLLLHLSRCSCTSCSSRCCSPVSSSAAAAD
jgi:hypothetical protein